MLNHHSKKIHTAFKVLQVKENIRCPSLHYLRKRPACIIIKNILHESWIALNTCYAPVKI
jgi:hypothetical protein